MRRCVICLALQEDVRLTRVVPGVWSGFNDFVGICAGCQTSALYLKLVKQKKILAAAARPVA